MSSYVFLESVVLGEFSTKVAKCFDEIMVLYNLIGIREGTTISTVDNSPMITFNIRFDDRDKTYNLYESLNGTDFTVYHRIFTLDMCIIDDYNLHVKLVGR